MEPKTTPPIVLPKDRPDKIIIRTVHAARVLERCGGQIVGASDLGPEVEIDWTQRNMEQLTIMQIPAMPRMVYEYDWPASFTPYPHQFRLGGFASVCTGGFMLAEPATGKTVSTLWAFDYLRRVGLANRMLVVCPRSLMRSTWMKEIVNVNPNWTAAVIDGTKEKRLKLSRQPHDIHIVNWDGIEVAYEQLKLNSYDVVVLDESTAIKNINRRWKFCFATVCRAAYLWLLTGTPNPQSPMDVFGQIKMVRGDDFPYTETAWKNATMVQLTRFKWVPRPDADVTIRQWMQPAIYVKKSDVLKDLPPLIFERRDVDMTSEQVQLMRDLRKFAMAQSREGAGISAVHAAALRGKIIQIASGAVYDDTGAVNLIDCAPRVQEAMDLIEEERGLASRTGPPSHKVLLFCSFRHTADLVYDKVVAAGYKAALIYGDTPQRQRDTVFGNFNTTNDVEVIVAVADVMAHGLTLTAATLTIWFTPHARAEIYIQANNRMDRPGQKHSMRVVELSGCAVENEMYKNLDAMVAGQAATLSGYSQIAALI